ncbi:MAG: 2-phospho-L-lactate guanylyltransferase [Chromatiales bacterium]|nr:2-phospho-L-lactate guanylyltransferase [Chromatiales bacterium]
MTQLRALVPVKPFARAKSRLAGRLGRDACAELARCMLRDVLRALFAAEDIAGIVLLSNEPGLDSLPETRDCEIRRETGDFCSSLDSEARRLAAEGNQSLLVLPADLPTVAGRDIRALWQSHHGGLTLCRAGRDGGSNALLLTPPDAISFRFGPDSAARHAEAARSAGVACEVLDLPAFANDIDMPADLDWLLEQRIASASVAWLRASGIAARLRDARQEVC